ncbi:MAG: nucleotidyltransferase family protein [Desulfobacterales bacterium]|nr:nucleotidyltransferase family protein [Desulfobacterales bacterium]
MVELQYLISESNITIKAAWRLINNNKKKVLFIVDKESRIIGAISDGDVRRWILSGKSICEPVTEIMNANPVIAKFSDSKESIKFLMIRCNIDSVPIVDENNVILDVVSLHDLMKNERSNELKKENIDVPVVIMAGGMGTRLSPFTKVLPKPLIPIHDKPIIDIIIDRFLAYSVNTFHISVHYKANMIKAYFQDNNRPYNISFIEEATPLGTGGALYLLKEQIDSTFFVTNCDILVDSNYADILNFHRQNNNKITLVCSMKHIKIPYGVVKTENSGELKNIDEKPESDFLINTGMYVLEPDIIDMLSANQFIHITDIIENAKQSGMKIGVFPIPDEAWMDIGQMEEYQTVLRKFETNITQKSA